MIFKPSKKFFLHFPLISVIYNGYVFLNPPMISEFVFEVIAKHVRLIYIHLNQVGKNQSFRYL